MAIGKNYETEFLSLSLVPKEVTAKTKNQIKSNKEDIVSTENFGLMSMIFDLPLGLSHNYKYSLLFLKLQEPSLWAIMANEICPYI